MPKKTRKEKIIVNLRRELKKVKTDSQKTIQKSSKRPKTKPKRVQSINLSTFIMSDLKRTLALSILAISLELMLYFVIEVK